jgi:hypothetical protein
LTFSPHFDTSACNDQLDQLAWTWRGHVLALPLQGCLLEEDGDPTTQSLLETANTHVASLYSLSGGCGGEEEPADPTSSPQTLL